MRLLDLPSLRKKLGGRSRNSIFDDIERGILPAPLKFSSAPAARCYWDEAAVDRALAALIPAPADAASAQPGEGGFRDRHSQGATGHASASAKAGGAS
jgi:predicted DNA-binding transcriptional regulator AlpA